MRVLVVEDDPRLLETLTRQLRKAGFQQAETTVVRSRGRKGARHSIFLGRKPKARG